MCFRKVIFWSIVIARSLMTLVAVTVVLPMLMVDAGVLNYDVVGRRSVSSNFVSE